MRRHLVCAAAFAVGLVFAGTQARADVKEGPYIGVFGSDVFQRHAEVNQDSGPNGKAHFDNGWAFGGSVGYKFDYAWRPEVEVSYRRNDVDQIKASGSEVSTGDRLSSLAVMGNVYYDILVSRWIPYIGVGAGMARVKADYDNIGSDKDWVFAYQFMAGLSYAIVPNLRVRLGYKFFGTRHAKFDTFETGNTSHNIELGLLGTF
jgi:opacity protein-like surface antigen